MKRMWTSAKQLIQAVFQHWVQALGGTLMAIIALVAEIK
jgi:hypothetical protein